MRTRLFVAVIVDLKKMCFWNVNVNFIIIVKLSRIRFSLFWRCEVGFTDNELNFQKISTVQWNEEIFLSFRTDFLEKY